MKIDDYKISLSKFDKEWALLTAGDSKKFNTMTISWGEFGTLWHRPVITVYVRKSRYTYQFINNNEYFTVSFYDSKYKKDLGVLGSVSGKDKDKISLTKLHPKFINNITTFEEANTTFVCKKLYSSEIDVNSMSNDIKNSIYKDNDIHTMFIGEVIDILE